MISPSHTARVSLLALAAFVVTGCFPAEGDSRSGGTGSGTAGGDTGSGTGSGGGSGGGNSGTGSGGSGRGGSPLERATRAMGTDGRAVAEAAGFHTKEITTGVDSKTCESGGANRFDAERTAAARENAAKEHEAIFKAAKKALQERGYRSEGDERLYRPGAAGGMVISEWRKNTARFTFTVRRADGGMSPDGKTYKPTISLRGVTDCL